jgi:hypothetical protein
MPAPRLAATLLTLAAATMSAQSNRTDWNAVKALTARTEVRITAGSRTVSGAIDRITDDTLAITAGKGQEMFDRQQVSSVSTKKPGHRMRNALIGLGAGTGAGLGIGLGIRAHPDQLHIVSTSAVVGGSAAAGAVIGTLVGAVIPTGGWREIYKQYGRSKRTFMALR